MVIIIMVVEEEKSGGMKVRCNQCGYEWQPRVKGREPVVCTRCKRYDWREGKKGRKKVVQAK